MVRPPGLYAQHCRGDDDDAAEVGKPWIVKQREHYHLLHGDHLVMGATQCATVSYQSTTP
jgi:hypothetical protein